MLVVNNDLFYSRLPVNEIPLSELLIEDHLFYKLPLNWEVIITDIKNSTLAVQRGLHQTVNLVATGSIIAVLNIAYKAGVTIPFFFGGDGASFLVPPSILGAALRALAIHRENTRKNHDLVLRVGHVNTAVLYEKGLELRISKLRTSSLFAIPVLLGKGLAFAEKMIKGEDEPGQVSPEDPDGLDLSGMECRWDRIKPPQDAYEVVSLLVVPTDQADQQEAFKKVIDQLDLIYGAPSNRRPISATKLKLLTTMARMKLEMRTRLGGNHPVYLAKCWLQGMAGYFYFRTKKGKTYLKQLVELSDTLVIDGRINTVIAGTKEQRVRLERALDEIETAGEILYGLFVSSESIMSCYVRNMNDEHVHFVDGAEGGYTRAAGILKKKISNN
jgi:hypothetical protein